MKILIIGGNRFVGAELVTQAAIAGHEVTVLALDPPTLRARSHVRYIRADRNNHAEMAAGLNGLEFDVVFDNIAFVPDNITLLMSVIGDRIGRYVLTSSVDIYSRDTSHISSEDRAVFEPSSLEDAPSGERYLRGKRGCELILQQSSIPWTVIRPANVYGRSDPVPPSPRNIHPLNQPYGRSLFMPPRVLDGGPILLRMDDRRVFRLAGVQDVASALLLVSEHPEAVGKAFNVAGDEIWTSESLVRTTCKVAGVTPDIVRVSREELRSAGLGDYSSPYGQISIWSVSDNKRLRELGWLPTPADIHLSKLVEEMPAPAQRPFYGRRLQEIALAERIKRRQVHAVYPASHTVPIVTPSPLQRVTIKNESLPGQFANYPESKRRTGFISLDANMGQLHPDHFQLFQGRIISSIGIGTHRGEETAETDATYHQALKMAIKGGINIVDTAINYRKMRSERMVGRVLAELSAEGIPREAICVCTKGGFIPEDCEERFSADRYIRDQYLSTNLINMNQAVRRHAISPSFIAKSMAQSLENLQLEHIDVYYLHNPERSKILMKNEAFFKLLQQTFAILEDAASAGKIGVYGLATWDGFLAEESAHAYLPLEKIVHLAREAGGEDHHFRSIQVPFNLSNQDALYKNNQMLNGEKTSLLEVAAAYGLQVFSSASVDRGKPLTTKQLAGLTSFCAGLDPIQAALQFARSAPIIGTALIGLRLPKYTESALEVCRRPVLLQSEFNQLRSRNK